MSIAVPVFTVCGCVSNSSALQFHQEPAGSVNTHLSINEERMMQKLKTQIYNTVSVVGYPILWLGILVQRSYITITSH